MSHTPDNNRDSTPEPEFDTTRKFVRVLRIWPNGLMEFEFSVGSLDVAVELVMPRAAFDEFCALHQVEFLSTENKPHHSDHEDHDEDPMADFRWSLHQATQQRLR